MSDTTGGPEGPREQPEEEIGSVGEEAAKLLGALGEWAREQPAGLGGLGGLAGGAGLGGLAGQAAAAVRGLEEHLDTGAPECSWCPICRTVHVIRETSPEVRAHLQSAASSFLQALLGIVESLPAGEPGGTEGRPPRGRGSARGTGVEHIDLEDDDPDRGPAQ